MVALRKESVDRNTAGDLCPVRCEVALRKESVDRNGVSVAEPIRKNPSLSARRAWIEIIAKTQKVTGRSVALRKESVDRNMMTRAARCTWKCRSPQGERG